MSQTPTSALANPNAARDHARSMAGTVVEAMPVLPPAAPEKPLPPEVGGTVP